MIKVIFFFSTFIITVILSSCVSQQSKEETEKTVIAGTIPPLSYFTNEIINDSALFDIFSILPEGHDPHTFSIKPSLISMLNKTDILIITGVEYEEILLPYITENNPDIYIIDASKEIDFLIDKDHHHNHAHASLSSNDNKKDESRLYRDPHIWLSLKNGSYIAENIGKGLAKYYENDSLINTNIKTNSKNLKSKIDSLFNHYSFELEPFEGSGFFIYHPSLAYFAKDFGFRQYSVETDGRAPTPKELMNLINKASSENIFLFFHQQEYDKKAIDDLLKYTHLKKVLFRPLNPNWLENMIFLTETIIEAHSL